MYMTTLRTPKHPIFDGGTTRITYGYNTAVKPATPEYGGMHYGADCVPAGYKCTKTYGVVAIADGVVVDVKDTVKVTLDLGIKANWQHPDATGNWIKIRHGNGMISRYCHLAFGSITVNKGANVAAGQKIANMGNTGLSSGHHVHFEIWTNANDKASRVDPVPYIQGAKASTTTTTTAAPTAVTKMTATTAVRLRTAPSLSAQTLATVYAGTSVTVTKANAGVKDGLQWMQIRLDDGKIGFTAKQYYK